MKRFFLFILVLFFSLSLKISNSSANEITNKIENNISDEIEEMKPNEIKNPDISNSSLKDIFGDEQTFPFVAGLGKNAAH